MAPTKMKLRVRRQESGAATAEREVEAGGGGGGAAAAGGAAAGGVQGSSSSSSSSKKPPSPPAPSGDEEASPDSKCPICLDRFNNLAYLDRCLHRFCFPCIQEWSYNKAECPLCKQAFTSILHSVRSHDDFKEYTLRPPPPSNGSLAATVAMVTAFATAASAATGAEEEEPPQRRRRRRRGEPEAGGGAARRRERGGGGRGGGSRARERRTEEEEGLLPPTLPVPFLPPYSLDSPQRGREELGDRGVLFEGLAGLGGGAAGPAAPGDRSARRLMSRLAARRRVQQGGGAPRRLREREMLAFRRALYRSGVRALPDAQGQPQHDVSVMGIIRNPCQLIRLRPWLQRELTVLYGAHGSLVDIVQRIITSRITRHGLDHTHGLEDELRPFLLARTQHFLHELATFARSTLSMERYDADAVYEPLGPPPSSSSPANRPGSSAHSSVIAISEGEEPTEPAGSLLSLSTWDEDTPGPSYSTAEPTPPSAPPSPAPEAREPAPQAGAVGAEEECLIVGYVKPMAERTPELVQLSSDTEEEEEEEKPKEEEKEEAVLPPLPTLLRSPATPPSSTSTERHALPGPASHSGSLPRPWSCSSGSPCRQESDGGLLAHSPGGCEGEPRRRRTTTTTTKKRRRRRSSGGKRERRRPFYALVRAGRDCPRSRSPSSSLPRSPSSPDEDSPWEYPASRRPTPPSSSSPPQRHSDKPGGKRKYKSRHLDEDEDPTWRPGPGRCRDTHKERGGAGGEKRAEKRGRERGRRRERERRRDAHKHNSVCEDQSSSSSSSSSSGGGGGHRSPSVEIIYEGKVGSSVPPGNKRRKKRRHHRKHQQNSSPVVITIDSHSSPDDGNHGDRLPVFSDLGVHQPIDFSACDLPALPLVEPGAVGGGLGAHVGELPINILARGSDWSDAEPNNQSKTSDVMEVDISDDFDDDGDERERGGLGETREAEEERAASDGNADENNLLATILDEIAQLTPGGRGQNSHTPHLWPGTKAQRRGETLEGAGDLAAFPPPLPPPADLPHSSETRPLSETRPPSERLAPEETRPLAWTRPLHDPGPFPETRPFDRTRPLKWNHPLGETQPPRETCPLVWSRPVSPTRPLYKPRPLSDHRRLEWTHPPALSFPPDKPRPLEWTPPLDESAHKQEAAAAAAQTASLPVRSPDSSPAPSSSSEAPPPSATPPSVNGDASTAAPSPGRESSASPSLLSPSPSQSVTSDGGHDGPGRLKLQIPVGPVCASGAAARTHITDYPVE